MDLSISPSGRRYGYLKDGPDERDYNVYLAPFVAALNPQVLLSEFMGPVLDQGQQGSCTAHAGCGNREFIHWKELARQGKDTTKGTEGLFSPAFLYYIERQLDGTLDQGDCGSTGRSSCMAMNQFGVALRSQMPYVDTDFSTAPTQDQSTDALVFRAGSYHRLNSLIEMKSCIASGYPFLVGFTVYESFESIDSSGIWTPNIAENVLGGHEVLAYGYDDTVNGGSFLVRNSWGVNWGKSGDFFMRYDDATNPAVLMDAWMEHLGHWNSPGHSAKASA